MATLVEITVSQKLIETGLFGICQETFQKGENSLARKQLHMSAVMNASLALFQVHVVH